MNCPRCQTELPNGAVFCPQCGHQAANVPIFPPEPNEPQQTNPWTYPLIGCAGCGCLAAVLLLFLGFVFLGFVTSVPQVRQAYILDSQQVPVAPNMQIGADFGLYGKTLDNEDFDWESLRGKYVLVKFTATWCGPCKMEIPGMLEAYEKYHDQGLEIVSVYIWESEPNAAATVRQFVEKEKLPWIIISESLSRKAGHPEFGNFYGISGVPTMLLVDKEGKVLTADMRGEKLKRKLKNLFEE